MQEDRPSRSEKRGQRKERFTGSQRVALSGEGYPLSGPERIEQSQAVSDLPAAHRRRARARPTDALRASVAVLGGRAAGALSRRLHLGGGTSIAGVVAQRLYPRIVEHLSTQLQQGSILVTGTNGKTTTSGFIAAILRDAGLRVWRNREGSNLMRGIAGALVIRTLPNGKLRRAGQAISVFEVDEAVMPQAVQAIPPRVAVFTNLFRDQLDRYGEVDSVLERWRATISALSPETVLVLNADDPTIADLGRNFGGRVVYFGIEDQELDLAETGERYQVMDTRVCSHCGGEYRYTLRFYSHIGHYRCPECGQERPAVAIAARKVEMTSFDRLRVRVQVDGADRELSVPLPGLYNVYNALAAIAVTRALGLAWEPTASGIEQFKPAFGRGERVQVAGRTLRMLLAKNPTGFNEVLRTLGAEYSQGEQKQHILFVLNDHIADGKDISWIWDVDFEQILPAVATLTVAGTRARDLALRLKYAGLDLEDLLIVPPAPLRAEHASSRMTKDRRNSLKHKKMLMRGSTHALAMQEQAPGKVYGLAQALDQAISRTPEGETLFIVPTYTGLLEVHHELERRGFIPRYWEETGP